MKQLRISSLERGMIVAQTVVGEHGNTLIRPGTVLTVGAIENLVRLEVPSLFVHDGPGESDAVLLEALDAHVRAAASKKLHALFDFVADQQEHTAREEHGSIRAVVDQRDSADEIVEHVSEAVTAILDEVLDGDTMLGITALKSHDAYSYQHGIDTAVAAALLRNGCGCPRRRWGS